MFGLLSIATLIIRFFGVAIWKRWGVVLLLSPMMLKGVCNAEGVYFD